MHGRGPAQPPARDAQRLGAAHHAVAARGQGPGATKAVWRGLAVFAHGAAGRGQGIDAAARGAGVLPRFGRERRHGVAGHERQTRREGNRRARKAGRRRAPTQEQAMIDSGWFVDVALKSAAVAALALLAARALRRRSAAERSSVLHGGLVAMALLPLLVVLAPRWQVTVPGV